MEKRREINSVDYSLIQVDKSGKIIGYFERFIIFVLSILGYYSGIAIVIAVKALARFKMLDNKYFAEKYIIGTLLNLTIVMLLYIFTMYSYIFGI